MTAAPAPALSISKTRDQASVVAGQVIDYHLTVTNTGNVALTGVVVTDANAAGLRDDHRCAGGRCVGAGDRLQLHHGRG